MWWFAGFYTFTELDEARILLSDLLPHARRLIRHTGADDVKRRKTASDLVKVCLDPSLQLPTFCSVNLSRIPPVGMEHVDVCSLLQEVAALRAEVRSFVAVRSEIKDMRQELAEIRAATPPVTVATPAAASDDTSMPDMTTEAPITVAQALSAAV